MSKDLYGLLELRRGASLEDVRKAHRRLAREYHPDVNPGDNSALECFKEIQHAYEVLSDPRKRRKYDLLSDPRALQECYEVRLQVSSRREDLSLSDLVRKLDNLLNSWKSVVCALAFFFILYSFLFYRNELSENSVPEYPKTSSTSQSIATAEQYVEGRRAETQVEGNDTHPDAIDDEQQDSSSYLQGTEPIAPVDLGSYPLSSTASANYSTPVIEDEGLTTLPTNATAAEYYSPDPLYEDGYYLPDALYEEDLYEEELTPTLHGG